MKLDELKQLATKRVRQWSNSPIIYNEYPVPHNHLFVVRGELCDFYETTNYVHVYLKREYTLLNEKTALCQLALLCETSDEFEIVWQSQLDEYGKIANNITFSESIRNAAKEIVNEMEDSEPEHFWYKYKS